MKKKFIFSLCAILAVFMAACGGDEPAPGNKVTITFIFNGGNGVDSSIEINENGSLPAEYLVGGSKAPSRSGYSFNGWLDGTTPVTAATTFPQNTTLTAQWTPGQNQQVTVTFELGGAPGTPPGTKTITNNTALGSNYPSPDPVWTGHEFTGWFNNNTQYTATTRINTAATTFTLTAQWEEEGDDRPEYAQTPAIHPGRHFQETTGGAVRTARVNEDITVNDLTSNVEPGAGVLSAQWFRATTADGEGEVILGQTAAGNARPFELGLRFTWRESEPGVYWYWVAVTNYNENATVQQTNTEVTQNKLQVTVTAE